MTVRMNIVYMLVLSALLSLGPAFAVAQEPTSLEYPYLYKSTRAMGMGGAYTAVGGRVDTLFYNPAGLSNIPQDKGWEVNLLNISAEESKNVQSFADDMRDALNSTNDNGSSSVDQLQAVNKVLDNYRGQELHARVADFTSIGKNYDRFAFGVGALASGQVDAIPHQGMGSDGLLEVDANATYGGIGGFSYGMTQNLTAGLTIKALHRESLIHDFTAEELVDNQNNLSDYIKHSLMRTGDAIGFDAGLIWKFAPQSSIKPSFGLSVLNIGGLDFGAAGTIPQTVNIGVAINPTISEFRSLTVAMDYVDVLNNFTQDKDMAKRLRYGAELQLFDVWPAEMALRAGMYEGYPTLGVDLRLLIFMFSYSMYTEEIGAYAGQDKNKRQLLTVDIGW